MTLHGVKVCKKKVMSDILDDRKLEILESNKAIRIYISNNAVFVERFQSTLKIKLVSLCPKLKMQKRDTMGGDLFEIGHQTYKTNRWECSSYSLPSPAALVSTYDVSV